MMSSTYRAQHLRNRIRRIRQALRLRRDAVQRDRMRAALTQIESELAGLEFAWLG
jgi:hypothetical protein